MTTKARAAGRMVTGEQQRRKGSKRQQKGRHLASFGAVISDHKQKNSNARTPALSLSLRVGSI